MNILAHLYLSGENHAIIAGNFLGDFMKGTHLEKFPKDIQKGILLHRAIDEFTDTHEIVNQSKNRLRPTYNHYSGVLIDIFFDHFLAVSWNKYHNEPLEEYAQRMYGILNLHVNSFPERAQYVLPRIIEYNWLVAYKSLNGIERVLSGMSKRTKYNSKMELAIKDITDDYEYYSEEFKIFFPELISFTKKTLTEINQRFSITQ